MQSQPSTEALPLRARAVDCGDAMAVVATGDLAPGDVILLIVGRTVPRPSRHTVQVGAFEHVAPFADATGNVARDHAWPFLNHGCQPNAALRGRTLVALEPIAAGDEVTFDYDTTEWDIADPFACGCGAAACRGTIRGFRHLPPAARERLRPLLASHLLDGSCEPRRG